MKDTIKDIQTIIKEETNKIKNLLNKNVINKEELWTINQRLLMLYPLTLDLSTNKDFSKVNKALNNISEQSTELKKTLEETNINIIKNIITVSSIKIDLALDTINKNL